MDVGADRWELTFSQPASDYLEFRNRLDQQNLSLENVVLREADQQLVGSIKVKKKTLDSLIQKRVVIRMCETITQKLVHFDAFRGAVYRFDARWRGLPLPFQPIQLKNDEENVLQL